MDKQAKGFSILGTFWLMGISGTTMLVWAQANVAFGGGSPTVLSPDSLLFFLVSALGDISYWTLIPVAGIFAAFWCCPLILGEMRVPWRTIILATLVGIASITQYGTALFQGLNLGGIAYFCPVACMSIGLMGLTMYLVWHGRNKPSLFANALAHLVLFAWIFSYAFPWFGEVP